MDHGAYEYLILFDGEIDTSVDFSDEDIEPLVVRSVEYNGIGDPTALDDQLK